ncbi:MAG TPA: hypothetical protein VK747_17150 [Blastocatellia bacterium]|nr:hypothetical protein [Blastocatellia bacterium]
MKRTMTLILVLTLAMSAFAKDHGGEYQEGTVSMSTRSGHEIYTFRSSDGRAGDVAMREKFSADSLKIMNLVDGGPLVRVMYRIGHKLGAGDFVAIPSPNDSKKEGIYFLTSHTDISPELVKRAAAAVPVLRGMMRDPDSFVLEAVYLRESTNKYSQKHNNDAPEFCYFFRSHNAMGGYGDKGEALLDEKSSLRILDVNDHEQSAVFIAMMTCTPNRRLGDITAEVKTALAPATPTPSALTPEEQAKRAQLYADCLKAAVNNPSIICKQ